MKPITLLLASALALTAMPAFAQGVGDACSGQYAACMDHCSGRPQSIQGSCTQTCENNTNICYEGVYGKAPAGGAAPAVNISIRRSSERFSPEFALSSMFMTTGAPHRWVTPSRAIAS